jgi:hypothetical protein
VVSQDHKRTNERRHVSIGDYPQWNEVCANAYVSLSMLGVGVRVIREEGELD